MKVVACEPTNRSQRRGSDYIVTLSRSFAAPDQNHEGFPREGYQKSPAPRPQFWWTPCRSPHPPGPKSHRSITHVAETTPPRSGRRVPSAQTAGGTLVSEDFSTPRAPTTVVASPVRLNTVCPSRPTLGSAVSPFDGRQPSSEPGLADRMSRLEGCLDPEPGSENQRTGRSGDRYTTAATSLASGDRCYI